MKRESEAKRIEDGLHRYLEAHDNNRRDVQEKLHKFCEGMRLEITKLEEKVNNELEEKFSAEDTRIQSILNEFRTVISSNDSNKESDEISDMIRKAKAELLVTQVYDIKEKLKKRKKKTDFSKCCELITEKRVAVEWLELDKPAGLSVTKSDHCKVFLEFLPLNPSEELVLERSGIDNPVRYKALLQKRKDNKICGEYTLEKEESEGKNSFSFVSYDISGKTTYSVRVKAMCGERESEWSDAVLFKTSKTSAWCVWDECPDDVREERKYSVGKKNPGVATKVGTEWSCCTIIGNTSFPLDKIVSWDIKVRKSANNDGALIFVGVAPSDIDRNVDNFDKCGWYFYCYKSTLFSGPPHNYKDKKYGSRKGNGEYVHIKDKVGVVMDTTKGMLSFAINGANLGAAYEGIPLDKPLVPCIILKKENDSVEIKFNSL